MLLRNSDTLWSERHVLRADYCKEVALLGIHPRQGHLMKSNWSHCYRYGGSRFRWPKEHFWHWNQRWILCVIHVWLRLKIPHARQSFCYSEVILFCAAWTHRSAEIDAGNCCRIPAWISRPFRMNRAKSVTWIFQPSVPFNRKHAQLCCLRALALIRYRDSTMASKNVCQIPPKNQWPCQIRLYFSSGKINKELVVN